MITYNPAATKFSIHFAIGEEGKVFMEKRYMESLTNP